MGGGDILYSHNCGVFQNGRGWKFLSPPQFPNDWLNTKAAQESSNNNNTLRIIPPKVSLGERVAARQLGKGGGGFCGCHTQDSNQNNNTTISLPFGAVMRPAAAEGDCCAHCRSLGPHQKALRLSAAAFHNVITYKSKGPGQMEQ